MVILMGSSFVREFFSGDSENFKMRFFVSYFYNKMKAVERILEVI
jgi:hypothetical protein